MAKAQRKQSLNEKHIIVHSKILCKHKIKLDERYETIILLQHHIFVLGLARGLRPLHRQCCPLPDNGGNTLCCAGPSLDNTYILCHHRPIPLPVRDFPWYMGFGHRPSTTTQRKHFYWLEERAVWWKAKIYELLVDVEPFLSVHHGES